VTKEGAGAFLGGSALEEAQALGKRLVRLATQLEKGKG
jgi:hypothetical protein